MLQKQAEALYKYISNDSYNIFVVSEILLKRQQSDKFITLIMQSKSFEGIQRIQKRSVPVFMSLYLGPIQSVMDNKLFLKDCVLYCQSTSV